MNLSVHPAAAEELRDAAAFYSERANRELGVAFISEFDRAVDLLSGNPEVGAP